VDGALYRRVGSVWRGYAQDIRDVTATPDGTVLALTTAGILQTLGRDPQVIELAPAFADPRRVVADQHGLPWLTYADGRLARFDGVAWKEVAPPPGGVASLSIDAEGNVMAVSRAGLAYQRNPQTAQWSEQFPGTAFLAIAVGPGGKPWFIGADRKVFASQVFSQTGVPQTRPASAFTRMLSWRKVPGRSMDLSIAEDGTVLRVATDGSLWRWNRKDNWITMPGRFARVAALRGGGAWALDPQGRVYRLQGNTWLDMRTPALGIASGPGGVIWIVQPDGRLARWDVGTSQWEPVREASPAAAAVAVGRDREPWIIDQDGGVKSLQKGAWQEYPGIAAVSLSVGPEGTVYATTAEAQLLWLDARERQWKPAAGKARKVAVGPKGAPWMIGEGEETYVSSLFTSDSETRDATPRPGTSTSSSPGSGTAFVTPGQGLSVFATPGAGGSAFVTPAQSGVTVIASLPPAPKRTPLTYTQLNGAFQDIGINPAGTIYAAGMDGGLYCFSNPDKKFVFATSGQARRVAVNPAGIPWVVSASGELARFEGGAWKPVPNHRSQDVSVGSAGVVISVGADSLVYRYNAAQNLFEQITSFTAGAQLQATRAARDDASGVLWAVTPSRQLLRCERTSCEVQLVGAQDVGLAPDNTVYILDLNGIVQRYNAATKKFENPGGQPLGVAGVSLAAGPQGVPWFVASGGRINYAGLFALNSSVINPQNCAAPFLQQAQAPVPPPVAAGATISAVADTATLAPGGTLNLLANDRLNGAAATAAQVSVNFAAQNPALLSQADGVLKVSTAATPGSTLTGNYTICTLTGSSATSTCASAAVTITVIASASTGATAPLAPVIGTATAGNASAAVAFSAPAGTGGSPITGYQATSSPGGFTATGTTSPITVSGLVNGTAYTFTVVAINAVGPGAPSAASNSVTPAAGPTVPGAPTIGTATAGNTSASVAFSAPASNGGSAITGYTATSSPGGLSAGGAGSPILVGGLTNGVSYTFTVTATNAIGTSAASGASNSVTPATVPGAPTIGTAFPGDSAALVDFTPPGSNGGSAITGYTATSSPGGISASDVTNPILVPGLTNGVAYTFTVTATNAIGTGAASAASNSVTPQPVPTAPTIASIVDNLDGTLTVSFTNPGVGAPFTQFDVFATDNTLLLPPFMASGAASPIIITVGNGADNFTISVTATNASGTGPPATITCTPGVDCP
jgi:hypothetical protein